MGTLDAGQAVRGLDGVMRAERGPSLVLRPRARAQHPGDRGLEVVVADLARRDAAQHAESVDVALQERLLAAGGEDAVHRLARVAQPHREQVAGDQLSGQAYLHVPEVDLRLRPGPVGLRNERVHRSAARLNLDLWTPLGDIGPDHRIGHPLRRVLVDQPVEDPLDGVPLLARGVQVNPQHLVDQRLVRIQPCSPGPRSLPGLRPHRLQRRFDRAESDTVLAHQSPVGHPRPGITADRRVQINLGLRWCHRTLIPQSTPRLPPQAPWCCQNSTTLPSGKTGRSPL